METTYRFLIQLVDSKSLKDAVAEIEQMFGKRIADLAKIAPGSARVVNTYLLHKRWVYTPQVTGFTVSIPVGVTL